MTHQWKLALSLIVIGLGWAGSGLQTATCAADDKKGTVVEFDGMKSRTPAEWQEEKPTNAMRYAQFKLPKVKDDKSDAEIVIFRGISGSTKDNVNRWKAMFIPADGKSIDDVSKVTTMKVGDAEVTYLDVSGTYKVKERPFDPNSKEEKRPDHRMLGVAFETKSAPYHIRLVGPAKTVENYKNGFDEWIKGFK